MFKIKNRIAKNILSALAVAGFGFLLLNVAFIFDFLFQSLVMGCIKFFVPFDIMMNLAWFPQMMHLAFLAIIGLITWAVFRTKWRVLYKAIYMTVPLATVFATFGMFFYRWPVAAYSLSGLFGLAILYHLYTTKQPWLYYYTLILVSLAMLMVGILGLEI